MGPALALTAITIDFQRQIKDGRLVPAFNRGIAFCQYETEIQHYCTIIGRMNIFSFDSVFSFSGLQIST